MWHYLKIHSLYKPSTVELKEFNFKVIDYVERTLVRNRPDNTFLTLSYV